MTAYGLPADGAFSRYHVEGDLGTLAQFMPRSMCETDPAYKQVIPYTVVSWRGKILCYRRPAKNAEARLAGLRSLGFGGHIEPADLETVIATRLPDASPALVSDVVGVAVGREILEETGISVGDAIFLGWLNMTTHLWRLFTWVWPFRSTSGPRCLLHLLTKLKRVNCCQLTKHLTNLGVRGLVAVHAASSESPWTPVVKNKILMDHFQDAHPGYQAQQLKVRRWSPVCPNRDFAYVGPALLKQALLGLTTPIPEDSPYYPLFQEMTGDEQLKELGDFARTLALLVRRSTGAGGLTIVEAAAQLKLDGDPGMSACWQAKPQCWLVWAR